MSPSLYYFPENLPPLDWGVVADQKPAPTSGPRNRAFATAPPQSLVGRGGAWSGVTTPTDQTFRQRDRQARLPLPLLEEISFGEGEY